MREQVEEGITTEGAYRQSHQEGEQEFEAGLPEEGYEHHAQQRQQADDGDGNKTPEPNQRWEGGREIPEFS